MCSVEFHLPQPCFESIWANCFWLFYFVYPSTMHLISVSECLGFRTATCRCCFHLWVRGWEDVLTNWLAFRVPSSYVCSRFFCAMHIKLKWCSAKQEEESLNSIIIRAFCTGNIKRMCTFFHNSGGKNSAAPILTYKSAHAFPLAIRRFREVTFSFCLFSGPIETIS